MTLKSGAPYIATAQQQWTLPPQTPNSKPQTPNPKPLSLSLSLSLAPSLPLPPSPALCYIRCNDYAGVSLLLLSNALTVYITEDKWYLLISNYVVPVGLFSAGWQRLWHTSVFPGNKGDINGSDNGNKNVGSDNGSFSGNGNVGTDNGSSNGNGNEGSKNGGYFKLIHLRNVLETYVILFCCWF